MNDQEIITVKKIIKNLEKTKKEEIYQLIKMYDPELQDKETLNVQQKHDLATFMVGGISMLTYLISDLRVDYDLIKENEEE